MDEKKLKQISKRLSLVLRHQPDLIGIALDEQGWVEINTLLTAFSKKFFPLALEELQHVVENNNKKRFAFSDDKKLIRASQGHSIEIKLDYDPIEPPPTLYHGTAEKYVSSIQKQGLLKRKRHHVHLSADEATAKNVGSRHGKPVILIVKSTEMYKAGMEFFKSENGVWLTDHVPVEFIEFPGEGGNLFPN